MKKKSFGRGKKTHMLLTLSEWDHLRLMIAVRELRLHSRLRVPQIAALLKMTQDEVQMHLRKPLETRTHLSDTLTLWAELLPCAYPKRYDAPVRLVAWRHESMMEWMKTHWPPQFRMFGLDGKANSAPPP